MSYQSDIFDAIQDSTALTALIGDRFCWDIADASTPTPYLVAQTVSDNGETAFDGSRGVSFPLVQFTAWSPSKAQCIAVISALKDIEGENLSGPSEVSLGFSGGNSTFDSVTKFYGEIVEYRVSAITN
jgi:hypothetical protein